MSREHESVVVVCPPGLPCQLREEADVRYIGLDVHREFCEVAICGEGRVRSAGRVRSRGAELELFAQSLGRDDEVALETTGGAAAIAAILRPHVARVVVVNTKKLRAISEGHLHLLVGGAPP
jgi:hypothetical protein